MYLETWILLGHILSVMVWFGGGLMLYVLAGRARAGGDPAVTDFARVLSYAGPRVLGPATVGTVLFGAWLVLQSDAWSFDQLWVQIGLGLYAAVFAVGAVGLSRIGIRLQRTLEQGVEGATARRVLLGQWITGYRFILLALVVATWDMAYKPGM
jgi:uncharacterized membrane protein